MLFVALLIQFEAFVQPVAYLREVIEHVAEQTRGPVVFFLRINCIDLVSRIVELSDVVKPERLVSESERDKHFEPVFTDNGPRQAERT